ncbi:uncharacterized protein LOC124723085 isoform X2 [Schistocerca piceifrons]|uniref:uncharacterized protein LOC124723085 isoform X2 n=1 Tax=Schistocerca piceifrons TaxID=274613 RepID=UPI001F5E64E0|nr:uncharacterized protein LOC124723085 isoform X2 [Schistocerca piceifrons]XP_047104219.1 uncharacterized protein LOC124723085 isoform X2 [Schistocerca piceifrons]
MAWPQQPPEGIITTPRDDPMEMEPPSRLPPLIIPMELDPPTPQQPTPSSSGYWPAQIKGLPPVSSPMGILIKRTVAVIDSVCYSSEEQWCVLFGLLNQHTTVPTRKARSSVELEFQEHKYNGAR